MRKPGVPKDEPKRRFLHLLAELLLKRLPAKAKKKTPGLLRTAWGDLTDPEQTMAVCVAFLAGVSAPATLTYDRLLSPEGHRRSSRTPETDPRSRAFRLGRNRSSRPLLGLLFEHWTRLDRGGQILAVELAECVGRLVVADAEGDREYQAPLDPLVPIVEIISRLPLGEDQAPLGDPRIAALERGAMRPLALEAALHRLGLTKLSVDDLDRPRFNSEALLEIAVSKLTELAKRGHEWRSFPGIWVPLCFPGRPTEKLCILAPEGSLRRLATNFAGAWVALACDCFVHAATCRKAHDANLAVIAGCALLALVPRDDPFMSRTTLGVAADVARLEHRGSKVDRRLRSVAKQISCGELRAEVDTQEQTIVAALNRSAALFAERAAPVRAHVVRVKRAPKRSPEWTRIVELLEMAREAQRTTDESFRAELAKVNEEQRRAIGILVRLEQRILVEGSADPAVSVVHAPLPTETKTQHRTRSSRDKRALRRLRKDQPLLDLDGLTLSPIKRTGTLYVAVYEDGSDSAAVLGQGSDGVRRARYARAKFRRCLELVSKHQASGKTLTVWAVQDACDVVADGAAERLLRDTLRLAREVIPGPRARLTRVNALSLFPPIEFTRKS